MNSADVTYVSMEMAFNQMSNLLDNPQIYNMENKAVMNKLYNFKYLEQFNMKKKMAQTALYNVIFCTSYEDVENDSTLLYISKGDVLSFLKNYNVFLVICDITISIQNSTNKTNMKEFAKLSTVYKMFKEKILIPTKYEYNIYDMFDPNSNVNDFVSKIGKIKD